MCKFSNFSKYAAIFLIALTFSLAPFAQSYVQPVKADDVSGVPPSLGDCNADAVVTSGLSYADSPIDIAFKATATSLSNGTTQVDFTLTYTPNAEKMKNVVTWSPNSAWKKYANLTEVSPESWTQPWGDATAGTQIIKLDKGKSAVFRADTKICWVAGQPVAGTVGPPYYTYIVDGHPDTLTITNPASGAPTVSKNTGTAGETPDTSSAATGAEEKIASECEKRHISRLSINPVGNALIRAQCAMIGWEASIIATIVKAVLFPSLGI